MQQLQQPEMRVAPCVSQQLSATNPCFLLNTGLPKFEILCSTAQGGHLATAEGQKDYVKQDLGMIQKVLFPISSAILVKTSFPNCWQFFANIMKVKRSRVV